MPVDLEFGRGRCATPDRAVRYSEKVVQCSSSGQGHLCTLLANLDLMPRREGDYPIVEHPECMRANVILLAKGRATGRRGFRGEANFIGNRRRHTL